MALRVLQSVSVNALQPSTSKLANSSAAVPDATMSKPPTSPNKSYGHLKGKELKSSAIQWSADTGPTVKWTTVQAYEAAGQPLPAPRLRPGQVPGAEGGANAGAGAGGGGAGAGGPPQQVAVAALAVAAVLGRARSRSRAGRRPAAQQENEEDWRADAAAAAGAPALALRRGRAAGGGAAGARAAAQAAAPAVEAAPAAGAAAPAGGAPAAALDPAGAAAAAAAAGAGGAVVPAPRAPALVEDPASSAWMAKLHTVQGGSLMAWEEDRARILSSTYSSKRDRVWRRTAGVRVPTQAERLAAIGRAPAPSAPGGKKGKGAGGKDKDEEAASSSDEGDATPAGSGVGGPGGSTSSEDAMHSMHCGVPVPNARRMRAVLAALSLPRQTVLAQENGLLAGSGSSARAACLPAYQLIPKNSEEYPEPSELARGAWEGRQLRAVRAAGAEREAALGMDGTWATVHSFASRRAKELEALAANQSARAQGRPLASQSSPPAGGRVTYRMGDPAILALTLAAAASNVMTGGSASEKHGSKEEGGTAGGDRAPAGSVYGGKGAIAAAGDRLPTFLEGLPESSLASYPQHVRDYVRTRLAAAGKQKAEARQAEAWIASMEGAEDGPSAAAGYAPAVLARRLAEIASLEAHRDRGVPAQEIGMGDGVSLAEGGTARPPGALAVPSKGASAVHVLARPRLTAPLTALLPGPSSTAPMPWPVPGSLAATLATNPRLARAHAKKMEKAKGKGARAASASSASE